MAGLTIIVSGMIAGDPYQGGAAWAVLQYVLGLQRLGHDVYFVEPVKPASLRGPSLSESLNAVFYQQVAKDFALEGRSSLLLVGSHETLGLPYQALRDIARRSDALLNISGMLQDEGLLAEIPNRVYLDLDPAFNQLWHATQGMDMRFDAHNHFVTVGRTVGTDKCTVPTCGLAWKSTFQPVALDWFTRGNSIGYDAFTTIANWRGYGSIHYQGIAYGQKVHSVRTFIDLPRKTSQRLTLALSIHPSEAADLNALSSNGWRLLDPVSVAGTPQQYRCFVQQSKAEIGIAKSGYVVSQCGWFSDRSACYLSCGRPVVAQETGFGRFLPLGRGLLSFTTADDAAGAIESVVGDYQLHSRVAREIAEEYFDSGKVLSRLLTMTGVA